MRSLLFLKARRHLHAIRRGCPVDHHVRRQDLADIVRRTSAGISDASAPSTWQRIRFCIVSWLPVLLRRLGVSRSMGLWRTKQELRNKGKLMTLSLKSFIMTKAILDSVKAGRRWGNIGTSAGFKSSGCKTAKHAEYARDDVQASWWKIRRRLWSPYMSQHQTKTMSMSIFAGLFLSLIQGISMWFCLYAAGVELLKSPH